MDRLKTPRGPLTCMSIYSVKHETMLEDVLNMFKIDVHRVKLKRPFERRKE
jgi:hypothetical protein